VSGGGACVRCGRVCPVRSRVWVVDLEPEPHAHGTVAM